MEQDNKPAPYDMVAEESLLGAMILSPEAALIGIDVVRAEDFYRPLHGQIFSAIANLMGEGVVVDTTTVSAKLNNSEVVPMLMAMVLNTPSSAGAFNYASIIYKHSVARKLMRELGGAVDNIRNGEDPYEQAKKVEKTVNGVGNIHAGGPEAMTVYELAANSEAIAPVVIPGMMHSDYRTIVVAEEGAGKSLLLRTIGMSASQGYHPFSHQRIKPVRVLIIDLENPTQAITQTAIPFMDMLKTREFGIDNEKKTFDPERIKFFRRPGGIEIRNLSDRAEIQREIAAFRPELVCIGPIYKMYRRGASESYEDSADEAMAILDTLRTKYGFALIMEHHAAKGKSGEKRELSPMGSQRWMAWPEIGISLYKDDRDPTMLHVKRFRGDRLSGVSWPDRIMRDRTWLVEGSWDGGVPTA